MKFAKTITTLLVMFVSALLALPPLALGAGSVEGTVTVGGALVDVNPESFKYGEYSGVTDDQGYLVFDADLGFTRDRFYLNLQATDAALENRSLYLEMGWYGKFKLHLGYDETPKLISDTSVTPFNGGGTGNLTLPAAFVPGDCTRFAPPFCSTIMTIDGLKPIPLETKREAGSFGFSMNISENIGFSISAARENKDGTKSIGGVVRQAGGGPSGGKGVVLPEPVAYTTNDLRSKVGYFDERVQLEFEYYVSVFKNAEKSLTWENAFFNPTYSSGPDSQFASLSLPPDNRHYGFNLSGGVNLPRSSRVSFTAGWGKMEQDEDLLPYTINPASTVLTPLPRSSAMAEIDVTHLTLNVSSRPVKRLGLRASYRYYDTDNKTPMDLWLKVQNDVGNQVAAGDSTAAHNLPYDYTRNRLKLDASYYLFRGTTVKLGYAHDTYESDFREADETSENTYSARVSSNFSSFASASAHVSFAEKRIEGEYDEAKVYDALHSEEFVTGCLAGPVPADCFDNHPLMRKFDLADRDRERYGANLTVFPGTNLAVGLYYDHNEDDYKDSVMGLTDDEVTSYTVDVTYSPAENVSLYAFFTREELESGIANHSFTASGPPGTKSGQASDPTRKWWADFDDDIDTFGVGAKLSLMEKRLTLSADYSVSESAGDISFTAGSSHAPPEAMPELSTSLHTFNAKCEYGLSKRTRLGFGYRYDKYESDDWATDGFDPASTTLVSVLTLSGSVPDYEAHRVMVYLNYDFGAL